MLIPFKSEICFPCKRCNSAKIKECRLLADHEMQNESGNAKQSNSAVTLIMFLT